MTFRKSIVGRRNSSIPSSMWFISDINRTTNPSIDACDSRSNSVNCYQFLVFFGAIIRKRIICVCPDFPDSELIKKNRLRFSRRITVASKLSVWYALALTKITSAVISYVCTLRKIKKKSIRNSFQFGWVISKLATSCSGRLTDSASTRPPRRTTTLTFIWSDKRAACISIKSNIENAHWVVHGPDLLHP